MTIKDLKPNNQPMNTGKVDAPLYPGLVISGLFVPYDWTFAVAVGDSQATILAALYTALSALLLNDTPGSRGFYVGPFEQFDDKGEATTYQTMGYGRKFETQRSITTKEYTIVDGGVEYWKAIQSFKGLVNDYKWIEFDNQGVVYGTQTLSPTTGLVTGMQGVRLSTLSPQDRKQANKGAVEMHVLNLTFQDSGEVNESLYSIETGVEIDEFVNSLAIQDVTITATGPMVAKVVSFAVLAGDGGVNICNIVPGLISASYITLTNLETGSTAITVTSWAIVNGLAVLTLSGAGAGWVPGDHMQVNFKAVSVLSAAGFKYYESNVASVVMVA